MKRLGIFAFYDKNSYVGSYVEFLLNEIMTMIDTLIIVINGTVSKEGENLFRSFTPYIIFRRNVGYDAGAYKEVLIEHLGNEKIKNYDQIVLFNNTFYGPFVSLKYIFKTMENGKYDFWGLNYFDDHFAPHVQSYFIVINQKVIESNDLFVFFQNQINEKETELEEIYAHFEVGLTHFLINKGYKFGTYASKNRYNIYQYNNILIKNYALPILKKRCFSKQFFVENNIVDSLQYINHNFNYDINIILEDIKKTYKISYSKNDIMKIRVLESSEEEYPLAQIKENEIIDFLNVHNSVYIYGTGQIARKFYYLYSGYFIHVKGFIVSDNQPIDRDTLYGYPINHISSVKLCNSAIFVALNKKNTELVKKNFEHICNTVLTLW